MGERGLDGWDALAHSLRGASVFSSQRGTGVRDSDYTVYAAVDEGGEDDAEREKAGFDSG